MSTIELSEKSITVLDKLELDQNKILVVSVDIGNLPAAKAKEYMEAVAAEFRKHVDCKVLISASNIKLSVIEQENEPK